MRFHVKCVQCGRVAGVRFTEPVSTNTGGESLEPDIGLGGYTITCPACSRQQGLLNPLASVRTEVAAILTEAKRLSA